MRRLLFAIGLIVVAVVALSTFGAPDRPAPMPTLAAFPRDWPTRIPAPTATPGPPLPTNIAVADLMAAFKQTSDLTSLKATIAVLNTIQAGEPHNDLQVTTTSHTVLTVTPDGIRQFVEVGGVEGPVPILRQTTDTILIGASGYLSSTTSSNPYPSAPVSTTIEPESGWLIMPKEQSAMTIAINATWPIMLAQLLDPQHDLPLLVLQGQEAVGGIACDRYFTDKASLGPAAVLPGMENIQKELRIWHCADGNLRRIEMNLDLTNQKQGAGVSTTMTLELIEAPTTAVITAPPNARPMKR